MNKPTYEQLQAQVKQLAAENAALKDWAENRAKSDDALEQERYSTLKIDYRQRLLSNIQTPATDAFLASLRAEGVEMLADHHQSIVDKLDGDSLFGDGTRQHSAIAAAATYFAAQLRSKSEVQS